MIYVDETLQAIWDAKERVYEETKGMSTKELLIYFNTAGVNYTKQSNKKRVAHFRKKPKRWRIKSIRVAKFEK
jgi:hypothetical protein